MKKACVVLAEGFEEIEALTVVDCLRRADIFVNMVSLDEKEWVKGAHNINIMADDIFATVDLNDYDILILPGGGLGTQNLLESKAVSDALKFMNIKGKYIAAICAAPSVLGKYGLLDGKTACCYPGFEDKLTGAVVSDNGVEKCGNIITARAMGVSIEFSLEIIRTLIDDNMAKDIAGAIIYNR